MKKPAAELLFLGAISLFGGILWWSSRSLDQSAAGPAIIPELWSILLLLFCARLIFSAVKFPFEIKSNALVSRFAIVVGLTVLYIALIEQVGYFLMTFVFILSLLWLLGNRKPFALVGIPTAWVVFSYFVFYKLMQIQLPSGFIWEAI